MHPPASSSVPHPELEGMRIGFIYNHDEVHQVAHTAPIISSLRTIAPQLQVDVLVGDARQQAAVMAYLDDGAQPPAFVPLATSGAANIAEKLLGGLVPLRRIGRLSASRHIIGQYDAVVVPETTSTLLKTRYGLKTKLIHMPHGVGDRSIAVTPEIANFDFVLVPGEKTRERMIASGVARAADSAVVGYPKFDALRGTAVPTFFTNDRPTVLYNPHFDPKLSSWFTFGEQVLDYFAAQDRFNLIFAPHVMLFRRRVLASVEHRLIRLRRALPARFNELPHIRIDTGSERSVDMSYTRAADIYLGDVSSQIYEFIERRRPAIFLNSHEADWQDNASYEFWKFGPVVDSIAAMDRALANALPHGPDFAAAQEDTFTRSISVDPTRPAGLRAAEAIAGFLARKTGEATR